MARKLKTNASDSLIESGVWMTPLRKQNGDLVWIRFTDSPSSHVLVVCQPGCLKRTEDLVNGVSFCAGVDRIDLELTDSPSSVRKTIRNYAESLRSTQADLNKTVLVIHRVSDMFARIRRSDTEDRLLEDLDLILAEGPARGVHVIMVQDASDKGLRLLGKLDFDPDVVLGVGSLTPVACEMVFGHVVSSVCVRGRSKNICWGIIRPADVETNGEHLMSGLFDLRRSMVLRG